ncbi:MAG: ATP-binding protein [Candidatus Methanomethylophilaceae archaeon]
MSKRWIIKILEDRCNGCGQCVNACPEGAIALVDGKARLVRDDFCDGLGACIGDCPQDAIVREERVAEPYDERKVIDNIIPGGEALIKAHLEHLLHHSETVWYQEALDYLKEKGIMVPEHDQGDGQEGSCVSPECDCHKQQPLILQNTSAPTKQWPIQLRLINPRSSFLKGKELLLTANCAGYVCDEPGGGWRGEKALATACTKVDDDPSEYMDRLRAIIEEGGVKSIRVMTMDVPCCMGLLNVAKMAVEASSVKVPIKHVTVNRDGSVGKSVEIRS